MNNMLLGITYLFHEEEIRILWFFPVEKKTIIFLTFHEINNTNIYKTISLIGPQKSLKQVISHTFGKLAYFLKAQKIVFCKYFGIQ
jgi:hypothetical protein